MALKRKFTKMEKWWGFECGENLENTQMVSTVLSVGFMVLFIHMNDQYTLSPVSNLVLILKNHIRFACLVKGTVTGWALWGANTFPTRNRLLDPKSVFFL